MALCTVTGILRGAAGQALVGTRVTFYGEVPQSNGGNLVAAQKVVVTTGAGGALTVDLLQGTSVRVRCPPAGLEDDVIEVPATATAELGDLLEEL